MTNFEKRKDDIFKITKLRDNIKKIADHYGFELQSKMLVEEMAELTKEVSKHWRGEENHIFIAEEIADVEIMLEQIKHLLGIKREVDQWKNRKILRQMKRMEGEK
jgi:hypothetical protein